MKNQKLNLLNLFSTSEIYHESSKMNAHDISYYSWINQVNNNPEIRKIISKPTTNFRGVLKINLPEVKKISDRKFCDIIFERRSNRNFTSKEISLEALSRILFIGNGVTSSFKDSDGINWEFRTTPSGGGLFPIDIYCIVNKVNGIDKGLYHYNNNSHSIEQISKRDFCKDLKISAPTLEDSINKSSICIILNASFQRIKFKYKERGYRFTLLEAGHIAQNILLAATSEKLGSFPVGGFLDDNANDIIKVDGVNNSVLYFILIGTI